MKPATKSLFIIVFNPHPILLLCNLRSGLDIPDAD